MDIYHRSDHSATNVVDVETADVNHRRYHKGQIVFNSRQDSDQGFQVKSGEVVIVRDGCMVDIVEPGESCDSSQWQHAVAIAWGNCHVLAHS